MPVPLRPFLWKLVRSRREGKWAVLSLELMGWQFLTGGWRSQSRPYPVVLNLRVGILLIRVFDGRLNDDGKFDDSSTV